MSVALKAIEATIYPDGRLETVVPLHFKRRTKVFLTIAVDDEEDDGVNLAVASEAAWGEDWNDTDEDEAWASLQEAK